MNEVETIMKCCNRNDELFRTYIVCLLQLKRHNETFKEVYKELRADYLVRGICEREIDEIIKESKEYNMYDVPKVLRWDFLRNHPSMIEEVCTTVFTYRTLNLSCDAWRNVMRCIENE
ncbi:group-specific protein [Bacillus sp. C1]